MCPSGALRGSLPACMRATAGGSYQALRSASLGRAHQGLRGVRFWCARGGLHGLPLDPLRDPLHALHKALPRLRARGLPATPQRNTRHIPAMLPASSVARADEIFRLPPRGPMDSRDRDVPTPNQTQTHLLGSRNPASHCCTATLNEYEEDCEVVCQLDHARYTTAQPSRTLSALPAAMDIPDSL
jgi:hypothetical protein